MKTLYFFRGLPSSGKTSMAKVLADSMGIYSVEADHYFYDEEDNYKFDASKLRDAHLWCQARAKSELANGYSVVVSNTSTTEKEVLAYQQIAEENGARFVSMIVETRHNNKNKHNVPTEKVEQMRNRFSVKL